MALFGLIKEKIIGLKKAGIGLVSKSSVWDMDKKDDEPQDVSLQQQYDNAYNNFPIITSSIDATTDLVVQDFYFEGPNSDKLKKWADKINLGYLFHLIVKHGMKNGNLWVEFANTDSPKPVDPKSMITFRKATGEVVGHAQDIDGRKIALWGTTGDEGKDEDYPKSLKLKNMVHFKFNCLASDKYGNSLIHPVLPLLRIKEQIESDLKIIVRRYAAPIIHVKVGDETHLPDNADITTIKGEVKDIYADTEYVTNYLTDMKVLGFEGKALTMDGILKHIDSNILAGLQYPGNLLGLQEGDKQDSETRLRALGRRVKALQRQLKIEFEDKVIKGLDLGNENDKVIFGDAEEREWEIDVDILRGLVTDGLVTPQKANSLLPPEFQEKLPPPIQVTSQPIGSPGHPQDQTPYQKGADKDKDNPTDPTKKQKEYGMKRTRSDREKPEVVPNARKKSSQSK